MFRLIVRSWRSWARTKSIAGLAILALALGIACATAVFTVIDSVLLDPLPYRDSNRWVALFGGSTLEPNQYSGLSLTELRDYQQGTHSFDVFGSYKIGDDFNLKSSAAAEHIQGAELSPSLLESVGVQPVAGRMFRDTDGPQVALISTRLWRRLGSHKDIESKPIALDGRSYTVVGVLPAWFQLPIVTVANENPHNDVWIPIIPSDQSVRQNSGVFAAYARLKAGVTISEARADAKHVAAEIAKENGRDASYTATLFGLQEFVGKNIRPVLFLFMGAAGLLLLVTCANVGGLLVARSVQRAQEIAVRVALGAQKSQLMLQFITEGLFISVLAAGLGVLASIGLTRLILSLAAEYIPRVEDVSISAPVLVFAAALVFLTALLPALAPLWQAAQTQPTEILTSGVRASAGLRSRRVSRWLVIAEIALAFLLLSAGGLLVSEFNSLRHLSPGFDANHLLTFQIDAPESQFPSSKDLFAYQRSLLASLQAVPGVTSAAVSNQLPLNGCCMTTNIYPEAESSNQGGDVSFVIVSPTYFQTMGIALEKGRLLNEHDDSENVAALVINRAAAERYWHGRDPLGAVGRISSPSGGRFQVVGVVGNVSNNGLGEDTRPEIYLLYALAPVRQMKLAVRSEVPPSTLLPALRNSIDSIGPNLPVYAISTMTQLAQDSTSLQRFASVVVMIFAGSALLLACVGIYSMTSYSLRERRVEFGTRMALGAGSRDLLWLILGDSWRMAVYGVVLGIPATAGATWLILRFVHLHHFAVLPYAGSALVVGCLATAACLPPAWRATFLSPMMAIRQESEDIWTTGHRSIEGIANVIQARRNTQVAPSNIFVGLIEATRRADSISQVLAGALKELRAQFRSEWVMVFERVSASETCFTCLAAQPENLISKIIPADGYLLGRLKFQNLLTFGEDEFDTVLRWAVEQHRQCVAEVEYLKQLGARAALSLWANDGITGLLLFGGPVKVKQYSSAEKELMRTTGQQLALIIENARLTNRVVQEEKVRRDVALAAEVQKRFLPQSSIKNESSSAAAYFQPARVVSGDCYDFLNVGDEGIGFAVADVAGKGVAAALVMAALQSSTRIIGSEQTITTSELVRKLNSFLYRATGANTYATFFYGTIRDKQLRYVNAGHNPPWLLRVSDSCGHTTRSYTCVGQLDVGGTVIGMFPEVVYEEGVVHLQTGDVVLAFTDGVTEALNPEQQEFGEERLIAAACTVADLPAQEIVSRVAHEVRQWMGDAPQHDDLTLVVIKAD